MNLLSCIVIVICGLNMNTVKGLPSGPKYLPSLHTVSAIQELPDPDESLEIPNISHSQAEEILDNLGYGPDNSEGFAVASRFGGSGSERIRSFQKDNGLSETGILDDETRMAIGSPRCGVKSSDKTTGAVRKWAKSKVTYTIANYPEGRPKSMIKYLIKRAFREWSQVTNLDFLEVVDSNYADIEISFGGRNHYLRSVSCSFENPKTLAHAFLPQLGDLHFNTKYFFEQDTSLDDFLDTALHEIGHSLGLDHINSEASLMHPSASNQFTKPQPLDVMHIQALYGVRKGSTISSVPTFCSLSKIDAAFEDVYGKLYAFAGDYFYDLSGGNPEGQLISSKWAGLPGNIDAAFQIGNGRSYFFKGDRYYRFKGDRLEKSNSRTIGNGFPGLPSHVEAAFVDRDGDIYVFKGRQFWVYVAEKKLTEGPWDIARIGIVPENVDAVVLTSGGTFLSFKGAHYYTQTRDPRFSDIFVRSSGVFCQKATLRHLMLA